MIVIFIIIALVFFIIYIKERIEKNIHNNKKLFIKYLEKRNYFFDISLHKASEKLLDDEEVVKIAIYKYTFYFKYASERLRKDEKYILQLIDIDPHIIEYAITKTKKICNKALKIDGSVLPYCPYSYQSDRNIILEAIKQNNSNFYKRNRLISIQNIDYQLTDDKEIILNAVTTNARNFEYASDRLKNDREIAIIALKSNGNMLEFVSDSLKDDKELILFTFEKTNSKFDNGILKFTSDRLKKDLDVVLAAVKSNGMNLQYAQFELRKNFDIALTAVQNNPNAFEFALESLKTDINFVMESIKIDPKITRFLNEDILKNASVRKALSKT